VELFQPETVEEIKAFHDHCAELHGRFAFELRTYVFSQATVIIIDDEREHLRDSLAVFGHPLPEDLKPSVTVAVLNGTKPEQLSVRSAPTFEGLYAAVAAAVAEVPAGRLPIVITDILFRGDGWLQSGIDLIARARADFGATIGLAAWTGFDTPFIRTAAYQRGADLVAQKGGRDRHAKVRSHGAWTLLLAVGHLCYQKDLLRRLRGSALASESLTPQHAAEAFDRLNTLLPLHAASLHLREEWKDTAYLLQALATYGKGGSNAAAAKQLIREKYGSIPQ
jgi:hypothetical protein